MKKKALMIFIVITLFVAGLFLTQAFAEPRPWQENLNVSPIQAQPNPSSTAVPDKGIPDVKSAASDINGSWFSPINPNYQPEYYWYRSPHDDSWSNAYRNWCCQ
ncbi:hypothetical protein [Desulfosporosinus shakirovi]|uniref:hypothetical protein n=1 Tax=Desulfosporosinus shakirovi TaxID=2885154 RepID=UPI001E2AE517|nr:hypothetical protein [Desulfosporosinus sp. SRJS8]MCB8815281.1 hypothetical protein [Desulfosporosinus sp. SRJS8]